MSAEIINGNALAAGIRRRVTGRVAELKKQGISPALAVVQVGADPASTVYVRNKVKAAAEAGIASLEHRPEANISQAELLSLIAALNADPQVHGILVQLPLPGHLDAGPVIEAIAPEKDVDGFHPLNAGRLATGLPGLVPCTPLGCVALIQSVRRDLKGLEAVIIGRSNIVGKPVAHLLLAQDCTVTIAHSRTCDLPSVAARADILIAAVGRPRLVKGDWVKPGAIVIDVGINRVPDESGNARLVGDVDFAAASERASAITPVPGGVGPMTVACLMANTLKAACLQRGIPWDDGLISGD